MESVKLSKNQSLKLINKVSNELDYKFQSIHWGEYGKQLKDIIREGEKRHRKLAPDNHNFGLTISQSVNLFYVKLICEGLFDCKDYSIKDYMHIRKDVLFAYSLAKNYEQELKECFKDVNIQDVLNLDYADLMKVNE